MRWLPWKRRNGGESRHQTEEGVDLIDDQDLATQADEALAAKKRADAALRDTLRRTPEVERVANALEFYRARNRWGDMMLESFQRDR